MIISFPVLLTLFSHSINSRLKYGAMYFFHKLVRCQSRGSIDTHPACDILGSNIKQATIARTCVWPFIPIVRLLVILSRRQRPQCVTIRKREK